MWSPPLDPRPRCKRIHRGRMRARNAHAEARQTGMDANFGVVDVVSITKPAVMAVAVHDRGKILKISLH